MPFLLSSLDIGTQSECFGVELPLCGFYIVMGLPALISLSTPFVAPVSEMPDSICPVSGV